MILSFTIVIATYYDKIYIYDAIYNIRCDEIDAYLHAMYTYIYIYIIIIKHCNDNSRFSMFYRFEIQRDYHGYHGRHSYGIRMATRVGIYR